MIEPLFIACSDSADQLQGSACERSCRCADPPPASANRQVAQTSSRRASCGRAVLFPARRYIRQLACSWSKHTPCVDISAVDNDGCRAIWPRRRWRSNRLAKKRKCSACRKFDTPRRAVNQRSLPGRRRCSVPYLPYLKLAKFGQKRLCWPW